MQCVLCLLLTLFSFVDTQQSSKCNIPILAKDDGLFVDINFPQKHNRISFTSTPSPRPSNSYFGQGIGSTWELSELTNYIKIEFSTPIRISSFAINSCTKQDATSCNGITENQIFTFDYQSPNSDTLTRLKPFHFQDGILELSENYRLPTMFVFDQILTDKILVSKRGISGDDYLVQLELYGCSILPTNTVSLNEYIQQYETVPSYSGYESKEMRDGFCNEDACIGLTGVLFDGKIGYNPSHNILGLRWDENSIRLTLLFSENIKVTNLVIHCNTKRISENCIPEVEIEGVSVLHENTVNVSDTSHGMFSLHNNDNNNNNKLEITLKIENSPVFILTEIEIFGEDKELTSGTETIKNPEMVSIYISTFFFAITLALIIPLLISVVVICFKIKKQTLYFPVQQNSYYSRQNHFTPKNQQQQQHCRLREQQQQQQQIHLNYPPLVRPPDPLCSPLASTDSDANYTPIGDGLIKRVDTNTLYNMYERIPTISTQAYNPRDPNRRGELLTPSPRPKLPEIPIYSVPHKKNKITVNRPSSQEGYLELRDMSVDDNAPAVGKDENPLYDYVRPRSALIISESSLSLCTPTPEYLNVDHRYINNVNTTNHS